jgi:hypothetical protein
MQKLQNQSQSERGLSTQIVVNSYNYNPYTFLKQTLKDSNIQIEYLTKSLANSNGEITSLNKNLDETVRKWEETTRSLTKDIEALRLENGELKNKVLNQRDLSQKIENMKTEISALQMIMKSQEVSRKNSVLRCRMASLFLKISLI